MEEQELADKHEDTVPLGGSSGGDRSSSSSCSGGDSVSSERELRKADNGSKSGSDGELSGRRTAFPPAKSATSSGHSLTGSTGSRDGERSGRFVYHPDLDQGRRKESPDANGFSPTRLQYLKAMSQIKGAAKRIEREEKVQVLKRLGDFFSTSDKNSDGQLTIHELTKSLRHAGYRGSDAEIKKFFRLADISDDQLISKEEFMNVMLKAPTLVHREMTMRRVFTKFDKDGNGSIDKDELKLVFEELGKLMPEDEITRMMSMADKDDSGALEYEEFIEIVIGNRKRREDYETSTSGSQDSS